MFLEIFLKNSYFSKKRGKQSNVDFFVGLKIKYSIKKYETYYEHLKKSNSDAYLLSYRHFKNRHYFGDVYQTSFLLFASLSVPVYLYLSNCLSNLQSLLSKF